MNTNNLGIPDAICRAIDWSQARHRVMEGAYVSTTGVGAAPLVRWLYKRHSKDVVVDYSRLGWCLDGILAHELFGRAGAAAIKEGETFYEETTYFEIDAQEVGVVSPDVANGIYRVSLTPDVVKSGKKISDYKRTSVFNLQKIKKSGCYNPDWERQLNIYRYGMAKGPLNVQGIEELENVLWLRDWGPRYVNTSTCAFAVLQCPVWTYEKTKAVIIAGLKRLAESDFMDSPPPPCSAEERWYDGKSTEYKPGNKCKGYCDVADFCPYFQEWKRGNEDSKKDGEAEEA